MNNDYQADYDFQIAVKLTDLLLDAGLITPEEHAVIIEEHVKVFNPRLAALMA